MTRPGRKAREAQAMHQIIHTGKRMVDAEFLFQNPPHILGAQGADPIGLGRSVQDSLFE